jgi:thiaminase/transcriptional activator TenA
VRPDELIAAHAATWTAATRHPFLDAVREGTLAEPAFRAWLRQDHLFVADLLAYQARLLARAPRRDQGLLLGGLVALEAELGWFEAEAGRTGLHLGGPRHPVTESYRTLLEALQTGAYAAALTALWTLERAYLEAWSGAAPGAGPYREYVEHWTAAGFRAYVQGLEAAAAAAIEADGQAAAESERAFLETACLERGFWSMAWAAEDG